MSQVVPFYYGMDEVRVIEVGGEPWFVARDVCRELGYSNANDAIARHCKGVVKRDLPTPSGVQSISTIPERDVYRLVMRSKLPGAQAFEEWVVGQVLPSIRRAGSYGKGAADPLAALNDPNQLRSLLLGYSEKVISLEARIEAQAPKVAALDRIAKADGARCITQAAKELGMKPKAFFQWMNANRWIYRHALSSTWLAYQPRLNDGLLEHKIMTIEGSEGDRAITQVRVTPKGLARIAELLEKERWAVPA